MADKKQKALFSLFRNIVKIVAPPEKLTVSEWADKYRQLSKEASSEPGQWDTNRAPYQREIMDAINDPLIEKIVVMTSAQVGKTEILLNIIGYYVHYDPSPILVLQPTLEMAEAFSKDRLAPMIRDTRAITDKFGDVKARNSGNTLLHKIFPGGHITLAGANSPASLASRPVRAVLADEIDRYPVSAGTEGDPVNLADKRTTTFWNRKKVYVSTPTNKGTSRIEMEYNESTMEEWNVPCPKCGSVQPYRWPKINFDDATMTCEYCQERSTEYEWKANEGIWVALFPDRNTRGFHLNELASPWRHWYEIIEDFKKAKKSTETFKVWVNTSLGESWEVQGDGADYEEIHKRRECYDCEVPDDVLVLTAGVDTQDDRFEIEVVGWGEGEESWGIQYKVIYGDLHKPEIWQELDEYLSTEFSYASGEKIRISCVCQDSGGHFTQEVYKFTKPREIKRIFSIKGKGGESVPFVGMVSRNNRERAALFTIGVDAGKETIISNLKLDLEGPGYCHFPQEYEKGYHIDYFKGLTSESMVIRMVNNVPKAVWLKKSGVRNEPLDIRNYAYAAYKILNPNLTALKKRRVNGKLYKQDTVNKSNNTIKKRRIISKGL